MTFPGKDLLGGKPHDLTPPVRPNFSTPEPEKASVPEGLQPAPALGEEPPASGSSYERDSRSLPTPPDKCPNVIAAGAKWKGSLTIGDSVRIDGQVSGDIDAKGTVHIAEGAQVEARVKAAFVVICGVFNGEVRCSQRLELLPRSKVQGDLVTRLLNVHEGATVDGSIRMSEEAMPAESKGRGDREEARLNGVRPGRASEEPSSTAGG